jgi:hypothetical protein
LSEIVCGLLGLGQQHMSSRQDVVAADGELR